MILEIDKYFLDSIGIDEQTGIDMIGANNSIIITPRDRDLGAKKRHELFEKFKKEFLEQYAPVLKRLAEHNQ